SWGRRFWTNRGGRTTDWSCGPGAWEREFNNYSGDPFDPGRQNQFIRVSWVRVGEDPMSQSITTSSFENPEDFVSNHPITLELIQHGVSELQLQTMRFRRNNQGWPFDQWPTTWNGNIPIGAIPLVKGYCALKWLIVDNPPYSREKEDAWRYLNDLAIAPFV